MVKPSSTYILAREWYRLRFDSIVCNWRRRIRARSYVTVQVVGMCCRRRMSYSSGWCRVMMLGGRSEVIATRDELEQMLQAGKDIPCDVCGKGAKFRITIAVRSHVVKVLRLCAKCGKDLHQEVESI